MPRHPALHRRHDYDSVFNWIVAYKRAHDGNSPTMREIADACHISSLAQVNYILADLEGKGRLTLSRTTGRTRSICVVGGQWSYQT